jgi:hypothetical protein
LFSRIASRKSLRSLLRRTLLPRRLLVITVNLFTPRLFARTKIFAVEPEKRLPLYKTFLISSPFFRRSFALTV